MIIIYIGLVGLLFGSFVNALVWRLHETEDLKDQVLKISKKKINTKQTKDLDSKIKALSISKGRSMCPNCCHTLTAKDLVPVFSWLWLRAKCRYCRKSISWQYPLVELATMSLFIASYFWWPQSLDYRGIINLVVWCVVLVGFMALLVYDLRWMLLPNRIVYPLTVLASLLSVFNILAYKQGLQGLVDVCISLAIASGLFYGLFQYSKGKWIGGGDVKLGLVIGFMIAVPAQSFLVLFLASFIGTIVMLPGLVSKKLKSTTHIPFGPFLIVGTIIVRLFGASVITWYRRKFLLY